VCSPFAVASAAAEADRNQVVSSSQRGAGTSEAPRVLSRGLGCARRQSARIRLSEADDRGWNPGRFTSYAAQYGQKTVVWDNGSTGTGDDQFGLLNRSTVRWQHSNINNTIQAAAG
jgi:hypothetical protein